VNLGYSEPVFMHFSSSLYPDSTVLCNLNPIIDSELDVKVKSIKDAGVLVKCSDPEGEFKKFVSKENIKENYDIREFMMVILQRLRISDISRNIQEEHIPSLLIKQNKHFFYWVLPTVN
jgi:hypothetical protein